MSSQLAFDFAVPTSLSLALVYDHRLTSWSWHVSATGAAGALLGHVEVPCGDLMPSDVLSALQTALATSLDLWRYDAVMSALHTLQECAGDPFPSMSLADRQSGPGATFLG